jgi:tetraacyldisaccharide 4'-kinase
VLLRHGPVETPWTAILQSGGAEAQSFTHASVSGDESAWLAAVTGVPVGVHPDRTQAAAAVLQAHPDVDLFLLDDGLQAAVQPDVELVLVDPSRDLRESPAPAATRETEVGLPPNATLLTLGVDIERRPGVLRDLTGAVVDPHSLDPVTICAAVGDPGSVEALALQVGLRVRHRLCVRDHRAPSTRQLDRVRGPLLITEKDAVGWAAAQAPDQCVVLGMSLTGSASIWGTSWPLLRRVL